MSSQPSKTPATNANSLEKRALKKKQSSLVSQVSLVIFLLYSVVIRYESKLFPILGLDKAEIHTNKPYGDFTAFYPFYLTQHSDYTCRLLHVIGTSIIIVLAIVEPRIFYSLLMTLLFGMTITPLTRAIPHGFIEFGLMMVVYQALSRMMKAPKWVYFVPIVGYGFAWVGHFYYELNTPATFIYPSYSLLGDFRMWYDFTLGRYYPLPLGN